jgi:serine/threonine protein kinase
MGAGNRVESTTAQLIGQYRILEPIGQGGMASVFKAYHPKLDRVVAIKMIHQNFLDDESFVARFEREAQIVARLEHPNIVPVYDYAEHNGLPYLVMKFVEGSNLKSVLSGGPLMFSDVAHVMNAISSALDYAHSQGILHRDIKPSNVMLDLKATPYLADFGLARIVTGGASTMSMDMLIGTPYYMSPEQARGDTELDARTDVYSLGVMLYELLTGTVPYSGTTPYSIIHQHITAELPPLRSFNAALPVALESVINRALAKEREARYPSAGEMMAAVRAALPPDAALPNSESSSILSLKDSRPLSASILAAKEQPRKTLVMPNFAPSTASAPSEPFPSLTPPPNAPVGTGHAPSVAAAPTPQKKRMKPLGCLWRAVLALLVGFIVLAILSPDRERDAGGTLPTLAVLPTSTQAGQNANDLYAATQTAAARAQPTRAGDAPPPTRPATGQNQAGGTTLLDVPVLSLEAAQANADANPDDPLAHLVLFRAQLEAGQTDALAATLEAGVGVAENAAQFVLTAARMAGEMGENGIGVVILRDALSRLTNDPSYLELRGEGGALLYEAALMGDSIDLFDLREMNDVSTLNRGEVSPIFSAMAARALLTHGNPRLAGLAIEVALRRDAQMPEGRLVEGEIALARGDEAEARRIWQDLAQAQQMPHWVRERLAELLG